MHTCTQPGCSRRRAPRGRLCRGHAKRLNSYGHPTGQPIPTRWLQHFAAKARRVIDANASHHPGLAQADEELRRLLDDAQQSAAHGTTDRVALHLARLASHGVAPNDILMMVTAVAMCDADGTVVLPGTAAYRFAVARAVCCLVPRRDMPLRSRTLAAIGDMLVERYSGLAAVIVAAVADADQRVQRREAAMSTPLQAAPSETR
jgi:hypothetical protein